MSLEGFPLPDALWWGAAEVVVGYCLLFAAARRPVSLRPGRLGWMALVVLGLRLGLKPR